MQTQQHLTRSHIPGTQQGFTLIETLTALTVIALLMLQAVPAFSGLLERNRMTTVTNELIRYLHLTRSEAIKLNHYAVLCKSSDATSCDNSVEWHQGALLFADINHNYQRDENERIVRYLTFSHQFSVDLGAFGSSNWIRFQPDGQTNNGTFELCLDDSVQGNSVKGNKVILSRTGRVRVEVGGADCSAG